MKTILVTGGAGYIGSHVCKAIAQAGHVPVTYDNLSRGHQHAVKFGPFERGDILDKTRLNEVIQQHKPAAIMHFAAFASVPESVKNPSLYYHNNVIGTLCLLEAMLKNNIKKIIFSSTCAVYGNVTTMPVTEKTPCQPTNAYGTSKHMVENILADYDQAYGLKSIALRYFNAAGSDADGEIGDQRSPTEAVIPRLVEAMLGQGEPFKICGTDYDTPDGTGIRDYIHVTDLAAAHLKSLDYLLAGGESQTLNLGTGNGTSVKEIVSAAQEISAQKFIAQTAPRRLGDLAQIYANASKAKTLLDWQPSQTNITSMIRSHYDFTKNNS